MTKPSDELIKKLNDDLDFMEFKVYLLGKIEEFQLIEGMDNLSVKKIGETIKARANAISMIKEILDPFINFREKKEPSTEQVQKAKDNVGL